MNNSAKPSGLTISRNGMKFTFSWKTGDKNYDSGQEIRWRTNKFAKNKWQSLLLARNASTKTVTLSASDFYPNNKNFLTTVSFQVRGKRAPYEEGSGNNRRTITPDWSDWAQKDYTVKIPKAPSVSISLDSANKTTFSWNAPNDAKSNQPFTKVEWYSCLIKGCKETDGSKIKFSGRTTTTTGTGNASGSISITDDIQMNSPKDSYTRWYKARSQGPNGASAWQYASHVYAYPAKPVIKDKGFSQSMSQGVVTVNMKWVADSNVQHPVDYTTVEYAVATPSTGLVCPAGQAGTEIWKQNDTKNDDGARILIPTAPALDECMWVRVRCVHDDLGTSVRDAYSNWKLVRAGKLTSPTLTSVSGPDASTHIASIVAENNSDVPDSKIAIVFRTNDGSADRVIGVMNHAATTASVKCPTVADGTTVAFGLFAFQGTSKSSTIDGVTTYAIKANMKSATVWQGGSVPLAPTNVTAEISDDASGEVIMMWDWNWTAAVATEISWSQNPNAWESTDEPERYLISNINQPRWRISGIETGVRWYFRARFAKSGGDDYVYGPYSDIVEVDLTSAPATPILNISKSIIAAGDTFTASWVYTTTDGTQQSYAEIAERTVSNNTETYTVIAHETTAQHVDITPTWSTGTVHDLCVRVTSASGHVSDGWSEPVSVTVADPLTCTLTTSLTSEDLPDGEGGTRTVNVLAALPMTAAITSATDTDSVTFIIERSDEYHMIRPDETTFDGYDGETIAIIRSEGSASVSINTGDLVGLLDDGAPYRIIATIEDEYGQTASAEVDFEVHWEHQAVIPTVTSSIVDGTARIQATAPSLYLDGDVIDIYRLSADKPELIVQNGSYGVTYVDPYPAIGENGGHRIVARTGSGDYITEDNRPAWTDVNNTNAEEYGIIIDFDGRKVTLPYDLNLSHKWTKDFKVTNYLGGSQQGDWNAVVSRTATFTTNLIADFDADTVEDMRALARHNGICHIRTPEGSSFAADIQVTETKNYTTWDVVGFTLTVTRIDPEKLDGMTLEEWTGAVA